MSRVFVLFAVLTLAACADPGLAPDATHAPLSWEGFLAGVEREPGPHGVWIIDGDVPVTSDKVLREIWSARHGGDDHALIVHRPGGVDATWSPHRARNLTYCVAEGIPSRERVLDAMDEAARGWEAVANVRFVHAEAEDADCGPDNDAVTFDVDVVSGRSYLARAFFPTHARPFRRVLIDTTSFSTTWSLEGILEHELGHALGFRHEHTRPESGTCFEDSQWRAVTDYDAASVMLYPHCNGSNRGDLEITTLDGQGAEAVYGAPGGGVPDAPEHTAVGRGILPKGMVRTYSHLVVEPGSSVEVDMTGLGDADLHVGFLSDGVFDGYVCRPFEHTSTESCSLRVPDDASALHIEVAAFEDAVFDLDVSWSGDAEDEVLFDDQQVAVHHANVLSHGVLDDEVPLDRRAAAGIVDARPFVDLAQLDAVPYVGLSAMVRLATWGEGLEVASVHAANVASFHELDVEIGLDRRAAQGIMDARPFETEEDLDAVPYVGPVALKALSAWGVMDRG